MLFVMVGVLILVDVIYMIIVTAIPSARLQLEDVEMPSNVFSLLSSFLLLSPPPLSLSLSLSTRYIIQHGSVRAHTCIHLQTRALPQIVGLCRSTDPTARFVWLGIFLAYKGILLIIGLFLAFETRKVKIRQLNDSKLIGMSVYGIVVLSVALAAIGIFIEAIVNVFYIVTGLMILVGNTCLLCLIFIPKV